MKIRYLIGLAAIIALALYSQDLQQYPSSTGQHISWGETIPAYMPTTAASVALGATTHLYQIVLNNDSASAVTVIIQDAQTTPTDIVPNGMSIPAKTMYIQTFPAGRYCPGGVTWSASAGSAVVAQLSGW